MSNENKPKVSKSTEQDELIPQLRFPEFNDNGPWANKALIDVADKEIRWSFIGGPFGSNLKASDYTPSGVRIVQLQNIGDGEFVDDYKVFTSESKAQELLSNNIYPGEILISKMGDPVGRACIVPETHDRYIMCSDGIRLVVDDKDYTKYFVFSLINSPQFRSSVEGASTGSTRKRIGIDTLKGISTPIPEKAEQDKIANCLQSIDELIDQTSQKLKALQEHKRGLVQQLLPNKAEATEVQ